VGEVYVERDEEGLVRADGDVRSDMVMIVRRRIVRKWSRLILHPRLLYCPTYLLG
jgi:hypothetical protein